MSITIELSPEREVLLRQDAEAHGMNIADYVRTLIERSIGPKSKESVLEQSLREILHRTPEEKAMMREALLAAARPAKPLPEGKTLEDMVVGKWPGDETDEVIEAALRELS
jgi:hypothetical protein